MKIPIIVAGYPKSGTTWLARLVGELLVCPVEGFLNKPGENEMAKEGEDRHSDFYVLKAHQLYNEITSSIDNARVIYIVRDVRDVVVSGARFFRFRPGKPLKKLPSFVRPFKRLYKKYFWNTERRRFEHMINAVANGIDIPRWMDTPWDQHIQTFIDNNVYILKYEDLVRDTVGKCEDILQSLGRTDISRNHIEAAVEKQSFKRVKKKFLADGDAQNIKLMREGKTRAWENLLTESQKMFLMERFDNTLKNFGYIDYV